MATIPFRLTYRPLKIGFLVREGNLDDIKRSIEVNTILCGGIFNPIIPVGEDKELVDQLIKTFCCDVLYPIAKDLDLINTFLKYSYLKWSRGIDIPGLIYKTEKGLRLQALDITRIIKYYWDKIIHHKDEKSRCILPIWDKTDPLANFFIIEFGKYPVCFEHDYLGDYIEGMKAKELIIENGASLIDINDFVTPIHFTKHLLEKYYYGNSLFEHGVFIGDPNDFSDLCYYWNLRATGLHIVFFPILYGDRSLNYTISHLEYIIDSVKTQRLSDIGVWFNSKRSKDDIDEIINKLIPLNTKKKFCQVEKFTWNKYNMTPPTPQFNSQTILANLDRDLNGMFDLYFYLPPRPIPNNNFYECKNQQWVIGIDTPVEYNYEGYTMRPPYLPELNEWYGIKTYNIKPLNLRVNHRGIDIIENFEKEILHIKPINNKNLIIKILEQSGIKAITSNPGLIAERIIMQMGGLEKCRVFQIKGVRNLIESKKSRKGITRGEATKIILDNHGFDKFKSLHIEQRDKPDLNTQDVFNFLLKKQIFRSGINIKCTNCTLEFWLSVNDLGDNCTCEYCGYNFLIGPQLKDNWSFRLSGLFGRDDHQEGSIPVILTLLQLLRCSDYSKSFQYTTALEFKDKDFECETDLLVIGEDFRGRTTLIIGECKTNKEIRPDDITKLLKIRELICGSSEIDCYLIFSKTASSFSEEELRNFRSLKQNGLNIILFTSQDLEPFEVYDSVIRAKLPYKYPRNASQLSRNSEIIYLTEDTSYYGESSDEINFHDTGGRF